jgi:hypothetical protein
VWVARRSASGDPRWAVDLPDDGRPGIGVALALDPEADAIAVAATLDTTRGTGQPWVASLAAADGALHWQRALLTDGEATAVAFDAKGSVLAIAEPDGGGGLAAFDREGEPREEPLSLGDATPRALASWPGGDLLVGGGAGAGAGAPWWVHRRDGDGALRWSVEGEPGTARCLLVDGERAWVGVTEPVDVPDPDAPQTWTTAVRIVALDGDGSVLASRSFAPTAGRREPSALAVLGEEIAVVGVEPIVATACSAPQCATRPWLLGVGRDELERRFERVPADVRWGRALAAASDSAATLFVGGTTRHAFAQPDAWLVRHDRSEP